MEAPDNRGRVRPLPPEGEAGDSRRAPTARALLPMLAGGAVLVAFIALLASGGVDPGEQPPAASATSTTADSFIRDVETTTTTTIAVPTTIVTREAPLFGELLPEFVDGLNVVVEDETGSAAVARWRLNRRFPRFIDLPEGPGRSAFDAAGSLVATLGTGSAGSNARLLSIGPASSGTRPAFVETFGFRWHDTTPGLMALLGRLPGEESVGLYLIEADAEGVVIETERIGDASPAWQLAGFHDDRLAVVDSASLSSSFTTLSLPILRLIDTTGRELASTTGFANLTSTTLLVGVGETELGLSFRVWDWDLGDVVPPPARLLLDGLPAAISPDGRHGATIVAANTSTVVVRSQDFVVPRRIAVPASITDLVFITDDHIAAYSDAADKLFVIEWRAGVVHALDLEGQSVRAIAAPGYPVATDLAAN